MGRGRHQDCADEEDNYAESKRTFSAIKFGDCVANLLALSLSGVSVLVNCEVA